MEYHVKSLKRGLDLGESNAVRIKNYLKMVPKILELFFFLGDFDLGALACPFIAFWPSSALTLLSAAIFSSMQLETTCRQLWPIVVSFIRQIALVLYIAVV